MTAWLAGPVLKTGFPTRKGVRFTHPPPASGKSLYHSFCLPDEGICPQSKANIPLQINQSCTDFLFPQGFLEITVLSPLICSPHLCQTHNWCAYQTPSNLRDTSFSTVAVTSDSREDKRVGREQLPAHRSQCPVASRYAEPGLADHRPLAPA